MANYITKLNIESLKDESVRKLYQDRLDQKITQNTNAYIRYINNRSPDEYLKVYKRERSRTTNAIKRTYWERFSVEMEHDLYGGQKKIWTMLRKRKKTVNEEVVINAIDQETWTTYFQNLYNNNSKNNDD
ncbi:hypothetical protein HUJ05_008802, partial [Dendroctonus ponderosae]